MTALEPSIGKRSLNQTSTTGMAPRLRQYLAWTAVSFLAIASPVLAHATHLEVTLSRPEMLIVLAALLLSSLAIAAMLVNSRRTVRLFLMTLLILISLDLQLGSRALIADLDRGAGYDAQPGLAVEAMVILAALGFLFGAVWVLRRHIVTVLLVYFGASTAVTAWMLIFGAGAEAVKASPRPAGSARVADGAAKPPLLLHIVLDAMMSPAAMTRDIPGADQTAKTINDFEARFGFRSYRQVYSRYNSTFPTLASMFNFVASGSDVTRILEKSVVNGQQRYRVKENRFFDELRARGYDIRVYQYPMLDFCAHAGVVHCRSQEIYDPLDGYVRHAMPLPPRMINLALDLMGPNSFAHSAGLRLVKAWNPNIHAFEHYAVHSAVSLMNEVAAQAIDAPNGTAIFFHLMAPHHPYIWDDACNPVETDPVLQKSGWGGGYGEGLINDEESRKTRYRNYFKQVTCVFGNLTIMLERLDAAGRLDDAVILIHGDHGSRISLADRKAGKPDIFSERDLIDLYATFFAVRSPRLPAGHDGELVSLQELFGRLFGWQPANGGTGSEHTVVVEANAPDPDDLEVPIAELPMPFFQREPISHPGPASASLADNPASMKILDPPPSEAPRH